MEMVNISDMPAIYAEECRKIGLWKEQSVAPREDFYLKMEDTAQ